MVGLYGDARRQAVPHDRGRTHEGPLTGNDTGLGDMMFGHSTAGGHRGFSLDNEEVGWDSYSMLFDVMHHEQPCLGTALLKRFPLEVTLHGCDTSTPLPLTCHKPGTFGLGVLQRVALVFHVCTSVGVPDSRGVFKFGSDEGLVSNVFCLDVTCWKVALEELPSAICTFTNLPNMWVKTKF